MKNSTNTDVINNAKQNDFTSEKRRIRLLKKSKKGLGRILFSRAGIFAIMVIIQVGLLVLFLLWSSSANVIFHDLSYVLGAIMAIFVFNNSKMDNAAKLSWLFIILLAPAFGTIAYAYTRNDVGHRKLKKQLANTIETFRSNISENPLVSNQLYVEDRDMYNLSRYISINHLHPVYKWSRVTYSKTGEEGFLLMLEALKNAKDFIFMEFFIIDEGDMWGEVLAILAEKAASGVEVRVMYDGMNEFNTLTSDYPERLSKLGIKSKVFTPVRPFVSSNYNYRDHRKNLIIDGKIVFTGGINLADEYINKITRFGYWKDSSVMIEGPAVETFTVLFLEMWNVMEVEPGDDNVDRYFNRYDFFKDEKGFVIPYGDVPIVSDKISENICLSFFGRAKNNIRIMTPYLILDGEIISELKLAAQKGVDVSIILPGIPDKKLPYILAKTHYKELVRAGVHIYEYTPGFVHSKIVQIDEDIALVGTVNLDYRSFYHHFECAAVLYGCEATEDIIEDFENTKRSCHEVTEDDIKALSTRVKIVGALAKTIAPLL
ncbi:MAG: cardiolipin synthase [Lachnospiraceae bacterium]|nr:cardiolipin synthase [Lachnospiraceae bacterium]